jgi:multidrug efflux system membrane fusion protein
VALNDCSLTAPFDGWIVKRTVDVGSFVGPATNGFTIASTRTVKAVFGIPDTSMAQVKTGQSMTVATDALTKQFLGHVTAISPSADPKSRVFSVEVTLNNPRNELKPGMIASIALEGEPLPESALAIPLSAVLRDPNRAGGFVVMIADGDAEHEQAHLRPVELGEVYGNLIAAAKGLHSGEQVITAGGSMLQSGDAIRVIP